MGIKRTQSYYEQIYKEYETSGKSVKDFCKSINLPFHYLHFIVIVNVKWKKLIII